MLKSRVFSLRLTPEEFAQLERAARLADRDVGDWARRGLLRIAKQQVGRRRAGVKKA